MTRLCTLYNERTTIAVFFAPSRHVHNIQHLRSRTFTASAAFPHFVALTHNLLVWAKQARRGHTVLVTASAHHLISCVARVRAPIRYDGYWPIRILGSSRWATLLLDALCPLPSPVQLSLPFARLHKT